MSKSTGKTSNIPDDKQKATWLMSRNLMRRIKQCALDEQTTSTALVSQVMTKYLDKKEAKK